MQPQPSHSHIPEGRNSRSSPMKAGESGPDPAPSISEASHTLPLRGGSAHLQNTVGRAPWSLHPQGCSFSGTGPQLAPLGAPPHPTAQWGQASGCALRDHRHSFPAELIREGWLVSES